MILEVIEIIQVEYLEGYKLKIYFSDSKIQIIDFYDFLINNHHSDIKKYLELSNFQSYKIEYGDLIWGDFEMCFPIYNLYEGVI
jgi:hypothetical protein